MDFSSNREQESIFTELDSVKKFC